MLLDNSSWMMVGEFSGELNVEDGNPPTRKKGSVEILNNQTGNHNYVWPNFKQTSKPALFKK